MNEKDAYVVRPYKGRHNAYRESELQSSKKIKVGEEKPGKLEGLYWIYTSPLLFSYSLILIFCCSWLLGGPIMGSNERGCLKQE